MNQIPEPTAVACSLTQSELNRRAARWRALADTALEQMSRTDKGQRLTFRADPGIVVELEELAALERDCCAFATWSVGQAENSLVLDISAASEEGVQSVQAMFSDLHRSANCGRV